MKIDNNFDTNINGCDTDMDILMFIKLLLLFIYSKLNHHSMGDDKQNPFRKGTWFMLISKFIFVQYYQI